MMDVCPFPDLHCRRENASEHKNRCLVAFFLIGRSVVHALYRFNANRACLRNRTLVQIYDQTPYRCSRYEYRYRLILRLII